MGRYYGWGYKTELDGLLWIDIVTLKKLTYLSEGVRYGTLRWTSGASDRKSAVDIIVSIADDECTMALKYTVTDYDGEKTDMNYTVSLSRTACNYGGFRYWFFCPLTKSGIKCRRRVRKLYCYQNYFGCRSCLNLCYSSQNENRVYRRGLYRLLNTEYKIEDLEGSMKRSTYAGRPTKKQLQLNRLYAQASREYNGVELEGLLLQ